MSVSWFVVDFVLYVVACVLALLIVRSRRPAPPSERPATVKGLECWMEAAWADKYQNAVTSSVSVACPRAPRFVLRPETWYDRFSKAIGLSMEFQTRDERFDQAFYILSDDPDVHRWLKKDAESRADLIGLLKLKPLAKCKVLAVSSDGHTLSVETNTPSSGFAKGDAKSKITQAVAESCVGAVHQVAERLARAFSQSRSTLEEHDPYAARAHALRAVAIGFLVASFIVLMLPSTRDISYYPDEPMRHLAIVAGFGVALLTLAVTLLMLWGSSRTHGTLTVVLGLVVMGLLASAHKVTTHLNQELDTSIPREYLATVEGHREKTGKHRSYYLTVDGISGRPHTELKVPYDTYQRLPNGATLRLVERRGFFGVPWISAL